jgi:MFS family permease
MTHATITPDSRQSWLRLAASLALMTVGSGAMYVVSVVLPAVQASFGVGRSEASLPFAALMIGFGLGGILMGRLADRFGVMVPALLGTAGLVLGYVLASQSQGIVSFALIHGVAIGMFGASATFAPLVADTSLWFDKRRGIAVAICACGNYLAGAIWPPVVQAVVEQHGWRNAYLMLAVVCAVLMPPLAFCLRKRAVVAGPAAGAASVVGPTAAGAERSRPFGLSINAALAWLCIAGVACCVAMSMPQVHIVAYCTDLGYGPARGAQMMSLMLGFGIVSRLVSGAVSDRIGGLRTLMLGSALQCAALMLFLPFDGMGSLYVISILFGLFQGGIVPSYALIVREHFPAANVSVRISLVLTATLLGMALGGWASGKIFDLSGSYDAAFIHGIGWNLLNLVIAYALWRRVGGRGRRESPAPLGVAVAKP